MAKLALRTQIVLALAASGMAAVACGGGEEDNSGGTGGGGSTSTGGISSTGGVSATGGISATGGTLATGGTTGSGGSPAGGNPLCDGKDLALGSNPVIDDFERTGEPSSAIPANDGRVGYWYVYNDGTAGDATTRDQSPVETMEYPTDGAGYDGAGFATHAFGYTDYGAGFGVSLNNTGKTDCYVGASAAEGIEFWIKSGETVAAAPDIDNSKLVVSIDMPSVIAEADGGTCKTNCYDSHVAPITVTDSWQKIQLSWDDFEQDGWSGAPVAFDADLISKIAFKVPNNPGSYNVVIDNLAFFGEGGMGGAAGGSSTP